MKCSRKYQFILVLILLLITSVKSEAALPAFRIALVDSTYFSNKNLKKDMPALFIYFSPTCEECAALTTSLIALGDKLSTLQIVMITNESLQSVKRFVDQYQLRTYKNIAVGTEGLTGKFLQNNPVQKLPYMAFYNEQGVCIQDYNSTMTVNDFLQKCLIP